MPSLRMLPLNIPCNLKEAYESEAKNVVKEFAFRKEHLKLTEEEFKEIADKIYTEFKKL